MTLKKGFTLIELLVVIAIIGILSAVGLTSYKAANEKARNSRREADIQQLRSALEMYKTDHDAYPTNDQGLVVLKADYLSGQTVQDPRNTAPYVYAYNTSDNGITYTLTYVLEPNGPNDTKTIKNP